MRILFDIGHPAHAHLFRNTIDDLRKNGHEILVTARNKEVTLDLLDLFKIDYTIVGKNSKNNISKIFRMFVIDVKLFNLARKFKPDVLVGGVGNVYVAHVSFLLGKKCILFNDTEHGVLQDMLSFPFADSIVTPSCYSKDWGNKHIRYNGYHELAYLRPDRFSPNPQVLSEIGLTEKDPFIIVRLVSWNASHDIGQQGIKDKIGLVRKLEQYGKVLITSEGSIPPELEPYRMQISPEKLHDLLYYARLYIGEGATTASECAVLGTHAIYVSTLHLGYTDEEEERYHIVFNFSIPEEMEDGVLRKAEQLLKNPDLCQDGKKTRETILEEKIDVSAFMTWFIGNYPRSVQDMKEHPELERIKFSVKK